MLKILKYIFLRSDWGPVGMFILCLAISISAPIVLNSMSPIQPDEFVFGEDGPDVDSGAHYDYEIYQLLPSNLEPVERAEISYAIHRAEDKFKIGRKTLISIIQVESSFDRWAVGRSGELGLMQIKPKTADWVSTKYGIYTPSDGLRDPYYNIMCGAAYIRFLVDEFRSKGHEKDSLWIMVIAAYNRGYWSRELFKPVAEVGRFRYVEKVLLAFQGVCDERI